MFENFQLDLGDKELHESEYLSVHIHLNTAYQRGGWKTLEDKIAFEREVFSKLRENDYHIEPGKTAGSASSLSIPYDLQTSLYLHPLDFSGYAKQEDIDKIVGILEGCETVRGIHVVSRPTYELPSHMYEQIIIDNAPVILAEIQKSKQNPLDAGFEFARHCRIPRVGDKGGLSSDDIDIRTVDNIYAIAKSLGVEKQHSKDSKEKSKKTTKSKTQERE